MTGLGNAPLGRSPYGLVYEAPTTAQPDASSLRRWLDPITGQYVLAADGSFEQMPAIRQRVVLALGTVQGSIGVLADFGKSSPNIMGTRFAAEEEAAVRLALRQLTDVEAVIRIDRITIERSSQIPGRWRTTVSYVETATDQYYEDRFG